MLLMRVQKAFCSLRVRFFSSSLPPHLPPPVTNDTDAPPSWGFRDNSVKGRKSRRKMLFVCKAPGGPEATRSYTFRMGTRRYIKELD